jgi:hypothetical protein
VHHLCFTAFFTNAFLIFLSVDPIVRLNMELLAQLDDLIVAGFHDWVDAAPESWKRDRFLTENSPIVVTSCYGQNAAIALEGNRRAEAAAWDRDRDYSKIAFLTVAIATSIQYASPLSLFFSVSPFLRVADSFVQVHRGP